MNKFLSSALIAVSFFFSVSASAYVLKGTTTDVGQLDLLLKAEKITDNSGQETETNWVNAVLNPDTDFVVKTSDVQYYATDEDGIFAFRLAETPAYFLIKNAKWRGLFQNNANADWGVINLSGLDKGFKLSESGKMTISHVSEFGSYSVPEPSSVLLLGLGLLGLCAVRRRTQK